MRVEAVRALNESYQRQLLQCGGVHGHLNHLYDNHDLTFAELKEIIYAAADGKLEHVSEKLDGQNLVFTFDEGGLKVARSGTDIKSGGMDASALAQKFATHKSRNVEAAFNGAFNVLNDAIGSLSQGLHDAIFEDGANWYSIEVVYPQNANVINYDANCVVFHASPTFHVEDDGTISRVNDSRGVEILEKHISSMQAAITQRSWQVRGPAIVNLKRISNGSIVTGTINAIEQAMNAGSVNDSSTIGEYVHNYVSEQVADLGLPVNVARAVTARIVGSPGAPGLPQIKKMVSPGVYSTVNAFVKAGPALLKDAIRIIELAINDFAIEVLRGMQSSLISDGDREVQRLRGEVTNAIAAIRSSGDVKAMDTLQRQMLKLGSVENITAAIEGVVFIYKGQAFKFTGAFSSVNQILGLFRYSR